MIPFLRYVARHYLAQDGADISRRTFVFPSNRSRTFFMRYLHEEADMPIFAPSTCTVNEFITGLCPDVAVLDRTALLFELYDRYRDIRGSEAEPFDEFVYWGGIILRDFDQIDRHMVPARQVYRNLEALKELDDPELSYMTPEVKELIERFWRGFHNPDKLSRQELSESRQRFLAFWQSLLPLYDALRSRLSSLGYCYEGQIYRRVAEEAVDIVDRLADPIDQGERLPYVFVGLFESSESELRLYRQMRRREICEFFWDERVAVIQDSDHPASKLLRRYQEMLGGVRSDYNVPLPVGDLLPAHIQVLSCASTITQVKALPSVLRALGHSFTDQDDTLDTAIVLPSEQLLLPVASSIPTEYQHLNITLGYPLGRTSVAILLSRIVKLIASAQGGAYPVSSIYSVLNLQLIGKYYPGLLILSERIRRQKSFMLSGRWIVEKFVPKVIKELKLRADDRSDQAMQDEVRHLEASRLVINLLLSPKASAEEFLSSTSTLLDMLGEAMAHEAHTLAYEAHMASGGDPDADLEIPLDFDLEFVYHYKALLTRLTDLIEAHGIVDMSVESAARLLEGLAHGITIPFKGNPLRGLQIMGLLESRLLHFPTLIYLSAQDGKLPRAHHQPTLIPYALRRGFGLPTPDWYDVADSYRFYQSISSSQQLVMLYGTQDALGGKGEESRYVLQMEMIYGAKILRKTIDIRPAPLSPSRQSVDKRIPEVRAELERYTAQGGQRRHLSPTALIAYLACPLRFYYQQIRGARREGEPALLLANNDFGTLLHETMESLYSPYVGSVEPIPTAYINSLLDEGNHTIERTVVEHYRQMFDADGSSSRQELSTLARFYIDLIIGYVVAILRFDRSSPPFRYLYSEADMRLDLPISNGRIVHFKGNVDRIDYLEDSDTLRILDYKTGQDKNVALRVAYWDELRPQIANFKAVVQTLLYCEMVHSGRRMVHKDGEVLSPIGELSYARQLMPGLIITRELMRLKERYKSDVEIYTEVKDDGRVVPGAKVPFDYLTYRKDFIPTLVAWLDELFDLDTPFYQTSDTKHCENCDFRNICGR